MGISPLDIESISIWLHAAKLHNSVLSSFGAICRKRLRKISERTVISIPIPIQLPIQQWGKLWGCVMGYVEEILIWRFRLSYELCCKNCCKGFGEVGCDIPGRYLSMAPLWLFCHRNERFWKYVSLFLCLVTRSFPIHVQMRRCSGCSFSKLWWDRLDR